jgi:hypothetical protein
LGSWHLVGERNWGCPLAWEKESAMWPAN